MFFRRVSRYGSSGLGRSEFGLVIMWTKEFRLKLMSIFCMISWSICLSELCVGVSILMPFLDWGK